MVKNTQDIPSLISFDDLISQSLKEPMLGFERVSIYKAIMLLALTTGLEMSFILTLKWKDLLRLGSENDAKVKDELAVRKYSIPIHPKVKQQLSKIYAVLGFPKLDSLIVEKLGHDITYESLPESIIKSINSNRAKFLKMDEAHLKKFNFDECTQVYFGRKVLRVQGYTNEGSKILKQHFGFRVNQELFDFLGFASKEEIIYDLGHINLDCEVADGFKDKNFNDGYDNKGKIKHPFQKFTAFSRFLNAGRIFYPEPVTNSIRIMLLICVYNGIRPSTLIRLKWKHIIEVDKTDKLIGICSYAILDGNHIRIGKEVREKLLYHFEQCMERVTVNPLETTNKRYKVSNKVKFKRMPDLNVPVFIMNTGSPITQPSLSREIKKSLHQMEFPHSEKLTSNSTLIMYGRRVLEIKGSHQPTIKELKRHFNFKSEAELFDFLHLDYLKVKDSKKVKLVYHGKMRKNMFDEILYDL